MYSLAGVALLQSERYQGSPRFMCDTKHHHSLGERLVDQAQSLNELRSLCG